MRIRPATLDDLERLVELNEAAVPAVSSADGDHMAQLMAWAAAVWIVIDDAGETVDDTVDRAVDGFVVLFEPGSPYPSPNYRWFSDRFDRFLYIDRVVIDSRVRGRGLGTLVYEAVAADALRREQTRVTAEVNLEPPNPGSSRFHRRAGFERIGEQRLGADYVVEMLARPVGPDGRDAIRSSSRSS